MATTAPAGATNTTSPCCRVISLALLPFNSRSYKSKRATVWPLRVTRISRKLPISDTPPDTNNAWVTEVSADTAYIPGLRASPAIKTLMVRSCPIVTAACKPILASAMRLRIRLLAWLKVKPATLTGPRSGKLTLPSRLTTSS